MKAIRNTRAVSVFFGVTMALAGAPTAAQTTTLKQSPSARLTKLAPDDAKRAGELNKSMEAAVLALKWTEAAARAEDLLALRTRVQGPKHFETINAEWLVKALRIVAAARPEDQAAYRSAAGFEEEANVLSQQGKFAQAQPLYERAVEINRRILGDDHPFTANSYNDLALCLKRQGRYSQAQPLYEKSLEIERRQLGDDHPGVAADYNNLASNLAGQGKYAQAQALHEKTLDICLRSFGEDDFRTGHSYNNLASTLNAQGKYTQAQPLYEKGLEIRRRVLGDDHPETATSFGNVGFNLDSQGRYAEAQPLHEKSLEILRRLLTDDHPDTAIAYGNVASNLIKQGKYAQAQPLVEKALEIHRRLLSENHPLTAQSYAGMAKNVSGQGKYADAQPLYEKALEINRRVLTENHPDFANSLINVAHNLARQGRYAPAQPLLEKALEISRRLRSDDNPGTAIAYENLADNLNSLGRYAEARPFAEKALEMDRRWLGDHHPQTVTSFVLLAATLVAQGKYPEARDLWVQSVKALDAYRLRAAFSGLDRAAGGKVVVRLYLAAVLARLGQFADAWQALEEDLGRGLLDELAARAGRRLAPSDRERLRELTARLDQLDRLVEAMPGGLDQAARAQRFEDLKHQRELASIALGEFQSKLFRDGGPLAGRVASLSEIQAALPADCALLTWVDLPPVGPSAKDPDGEHWGVVVRSSGLPTWVPLDGTGASGRWTTDDTELARRVRTELRRLAADKRAELVHLLDRLRQQRIEPLRRALTGRADQQQARRLIVLPSRSMAGIPIEALLSSDDTWTVSYAPSASVFKYLREPLRPDRHAGLLALGDPEYQQRDKSSAPESLPDHGLLLGFVAPGSNAATHGLKPGDVLLAYNGLALKKRDDLKVVTGGDQPVGVEIWRDGRTLRRQLAPGKLGAIVDSRPAPDALAANRAMSTLLTAARSGGDGDFAPLPGTRYEVEALAREFQSSGRPTRILLGSDASEPELDRLSGSGELTRYGFIHLATHGVIDEAMPTSSAVILTQTGLPDPLTQVLNHRPAFDGRLSVREIQRGWDLKAELVTLSACETALGREAGGEGFVGFTQALLISGTRSVCLSLWKVDDTGTALLMQRFYANLLGRRSGLSAPMPKAEGLREAKVWLRGLRRAEALAVAAAISGGVERGKGSKGRQPVDLAATVPSGGDNDPPYASPHFWAAFVLAGDPD
jgi:tetratricopeptide (TPR) repeat protein